jgi:hypothetical protein
MNVKRMVAMVLVLVSIAVITGCQGGYNHQTVSMNQMQWRQGITSTPHPQDLRP